MIAMPITRVRTVLGAAVLATAAGCAEGRDAPRHLADTFASTAASTGNSCTIPGTPTPMPRDVKESSGLAQSRTFPDALWTHNDAGNPATLYAVATDGRLLSTVRVTGAQSVDWEDIASGPCAGGGHCLYVGDIGDNDAKRRSITVYVVPEPGVGETATAPATAITASYPEGPRDAEALFVDEAGAIHIVTKGRTGPIELYVMERTGTRHALRLVRELFPKPANANDRVTGAAISPDGRWVALRSYRTLFVYPAAALVDPRTRRVAPTEHDLRAAGEAQGEGVVLENDGTVWLASEAQGKGAPTLSRLHCSLPNGAAAP